MFEITSKLGFDGETSAGRPSSTIAQSGREAEFQDALDRYMADYIRQQALVTRPSTSDLGASLLLQRRTVEWLGGQLQMRCQSFARYRT